MRHDNVGALAVAGAVLLAALGAPKHAAAQDAGTAYPKMAAIDEYLIPDRDAEIAMARSAAPASISRDATIMVLGRSGFETAVQGKNGFVCMVDRAWSGPFGWPESWNPKVRGAVCLNPQAARSIVPIDQLRTKMVLAGRSRAEIVSALEAAYAGKRLPKLESGAMAYMLSPSAYLTDEDDHNGPHLMFYTDVKNAADWGSGAEGSPIMSSPYWYFSPKEQAEVKRLPQILVFLIGAPKWSDGTPARGHGD